VGVVVFGQFMEVLIGGLLAGVLYSLVALGFVLIFKASGVFNFAQGAMVLLAGLALSTSWWNAGCRFGRRSCSASCSPASSWRYAHG
jgi:branched-subunit amino acid ABC-type transport system permease component